MSTAFTEDLRREAALFCNQGIADHLCAAATEIERLREDDDCGGGVSGCQNMRRMCRSCQVKQQAAEVAALRETVEKYETVCSAVKALLEVADLPEEAGEAIGQAERLIAAAEAAAKGKE